MIIRQQTLKAALIAAAKDDSRSRNGMVHIEPAGAVVATDGSILVLIRDRYPQDDKDFPVKDLLPLDPLTAPVTLPRGTVERVLKGVPRKSVIPVLTSVQVGRYAQSTVAQATDLTVPIRAIVGDDEQPTFPDYKRVLTPEGRPHIKLTLSAAMLTKLAQLGKELHDNQRSPCAVTLEIPTAEDLRDESGITCAVHFTVKGGTLEAEGEVMPCRI